MSKDQKNILRYPSLNELDEEDQDDYEDIYEEVSDLYLDMDLEGLEDIKYTPETYSYCNKVSYNRLKLDGENDNKFKLSQIKVNIVQISNFNKKLLPCILKENVLTILITNSIMNVKKLISTDKCKIYHSNINRVKKDITGMTLCYVFGALHTYPIDELMRQLGFGHIRFSNVEFETFLNQEQNFKKLAGKYVKVDRSIMQDIYFNAPGLTDNPDSLSMRQELEKNSFESLGYENFKILIHQKNLNEADIDFVLNWSLDQDLINEKTFKFIKVLAKCNNRLEDWDKTFFDILDKKMLNNNNIEQSFFDSFNQLEKSLMKADFNDILKTVNKDALLTNLNSLVESLKDLPETVHLGKTNFNVFGYSSDAYNEFKFLLDDLMNGLTTGGIKIKKLTQNLLKSFLYNIRSHLTTLASKNDEVFYDNDYLMLVFFSSLLNFTVIDENSDDHVFKDFLINISTSYNIERAEYLMKKYPIKKLRKPIVKSDSQKTIEKFKKEFGIG